MGKDFHEQDQWHYLLDDEVEDLSEVHPKKDIGKGLKMVGSNRKLLTSLGF